MSKLIFCKFLDSEGNPRGRDYTYKTDVEVVPGDNVLVEVVRGSEGASTKKVVVTKTDLTPDMIPGYDNFKDSIKNIIGIAPDEENKTEGETLPDTPSKPAGETPPTDNQEPLDEFDMEDL